MHHVENSSFQKRKGLLILPILLLLGAYAVQEVPASSTGTTGDSKSGCGGNSCHGTSSGATSVTIWSNDTAFEAGGTYLFYVKVRNANSTGYGAGCDISADNGGKLSALSSDLQGSGSELTQTRPHPISIDSVMWGFTYTTPTTPGLAHIYAAGIVANLNGIADAGDVWGTTSLAINIVTPTHLTVDAPQVFRAISEDTASQWITLHNPGTSVRIIQGYSLDYPSFPDEGAFQFIDTSLHSIPAGGSGKIEVLFRPGIARDDYVNYLYIYTNDASAPKTVVGLKGIGVAYNNVLSISPNPVNFRQVKIGKVDSIRVVMRDTGKTTIGINGVFLFGSGTGVQQLSFGGSTFQKTFYPGDSLVCHAYYHPLVAKVDSLVVGIYQADGVTFIGGLTIVGEGVLNMDVNRPKAKDGFSVIPNPTSGLIRIEDLKGSSEGSVDAEIVDASGRIVLRQTLQLTDECFLNVTSLPSGAYILCVHPKVGEVIVRRILIESR